MLVVLPETLHLKSDKPQPRRVGSPTFSSQIEGYKRMLNNRNLIICMLITLLSQFRAHYEAIFIIYSSVAFNLRTSKVSSLLAIIPAASFLVFLALPTITSKMSQRLQITPQHQTLLVARFMLFVMVLGTVLTALSTSISRLTIALFIFALGNGIRAPILSVASSYLPGTTQTGKLYTLMSAMDALAHVLGDPSVQGIWSLGLRWGKGWTTFPFWVLSILFLIAFVSSWTLRAVDSESEGGRRSSSPLGQAGGEEATTGLLQEQERDEFD